ncbi:MAG TPA: hypothetical protein VII83_02975 [Gaiellaceae bacterium]
MKRTQPAQLLLMVAAVAAFGCLAFSLPASGAPMVSGLTANSTVKALFHTGFIRAEIVTFSSGQVGDYRVDRGVVRNVRGRVLTLVERDGVVVRVRLSPSTQIRVGAQTGTARSVRPGMRATVMNKGTSAASWLYATRTSSDNSEPTIRSLLSTGFVRAEVISWADGAVLDSRADTGVIESADDTSLTLQESDGTRVQMQIDSSTQLLVNLSAASAADLAAGMRATTISNGDGVASQIWAYGKKLSVGRK